MTTWLMEAVAPRSTCSHWSSLAADDHRVPVLPSTAALAGVPAFSMVEDVAVLPWDRLVSALAAAAAGSWVRGRVIRAAVAASATPRDLSLMKVPAGASGKPGERRRQGLGTGCVRRGGA